MIELLTFALFVFGVTYGICRSTALMPARVWLGRVALIRMLIYCAYCTSFWVGAAFAACGIYPMRYETEWLCVLEGAFVAVGSTVVLGRAIVQGLTWDEERDVLDPQDAQESRH